MTLYETYELQCQKEFSNTQNIFQLATKLDTESLPRAVPSWHNGSARWTSNSKVVGLRPIEAGRFFNL